MIYPLFERMVQNQWVNAGFLRDFGWGSPSDFLAPDTLRMLASPAPAQEPLRRQIFERFRNPSYTSMEYGALPPYYGDGVDLPATNPRQWMAVLPIQYAWLLQWANGDFDADWPAGGLTFPEQLEDLPIAEQPAALDRAVLDECLGGPFHPGCELTWPMRQTLLYEAPFRLRRRVEAEPDWGPADDVGDRTGRGWAVARQWPRRSDAVDGGALANRYVELPLAVQARRRRLPAHLLAGAGPERRPRSGELPRRSWIAPAVSKSGNVRSRTE